MNVIHVTPINYELRTSEQTQRVLAAWTQQVLTAWIALGKDEHHG